MLLTAQRVVAPGTQIEGINAFLWRHIQRVAGIDWKNPDVTRIAEEFPGTLSAVRTEIPPGGNIVRAYLDVAAEDDVETGAIDLALQKVGEQLSPAMLDQPIQIGLVAVRFGTSLDLAGTLAEAFEALRKHALELLHDQSASSSTARQPPLRVTVTQNADSRVFHLDPSSLGRLQSFHEATKQPWREAKISVTMDVEAALRAVWGDLGQHLAPVLTGVPLDRLGALGGIQFVEADTERPLWEWPPKAGGPGYCLSCHQHGTLSREPSGFVCAYCGNHQESDGLWVAALQ